MDDTLLAASGALFHNADGRVLLVEPTYKPDWEIPGGLMEGLESPRECCLREVREELGLDIEPGRLLVVDWAPHDGRAHVRFVFDGGLLDADEERAIVLQADELRSSAWVRPQDVAAMTAPRLARRVGAALGARAVGETWYLEQGARP